MKSDKIDLDGEDWEQQLVAALSEIPVEPAPASLQRKLRAIPRESRAGSGWSRPGSIFNLFAPRWAIAAIALPLALGLGIHLQSERRAHEQQIAQGRHDLAVALGYLARANEKASHRVSTAIYGGVVEPVAGNTRDLIQQPFDIVREIQL